MEARKVTIGRTVEDVIDERLTDPETVEETPAPEEAPEEEVPTTIEELDPEDELWPAGPKIAQIKEWKDEFGDVYVTSLGLDNHVVWRTMDRGEWRRLMKLMDQATADGKMSTTEANMFQEEYITEMCTLYPRFNRLEPNAVLAGMPSIISQEVLEASGFVALEIRQL